MKTDKWIIATLFFSIFLYAEPITKEKPFDNLPIKTEIKKDKLKDIAKEDNKTSISDKVQIDLALKLTKKRVSLPKEISHKKRFLKRFYRQNSYLPLWFDSKGISKKSSELFKIIEDDITLNKEGKIYKRYLYLKSYLKSKDRDNTHAELYLTVLYIDFLNHTIYGSIKWKSFSLQLKNFRRRGIPANWVTYKPKFSISELLLKPNIKDTINEVTPKRFGYSRLLKALKKLIELKKRGGWEQLPHIKKLELGDKGLIVLKLRERLEASGDIAVCESTAVNLFEAEDSEEADIKIQPEATFDKCLEDGVKNFQARHGLEADGIVGSATRKILNITVEDKIKKVLLNIDRVKWLPREEDKRYIIVNIPEFMLHYIEDGKEKDTIPVIVGKKRHNTPIFKGDISYIVLNPYWKVPEGIVRKEIIPHMIRNPRYLRKEGLEIHVNWYEKSRKINPYNIYWEDYYNGYMKFPYRIMQPPGPKNALGKIKFKFPNRFNVYLHDTPTKRLFQKTKRAYSHGCIRVSKPVKLFETIASFNNIDLNKSKKILKGKTKVQINIKNVVPVYIIYLTAGYSEKNKEVEFRDDVYGYDKIQKRVD